MPAVFRTNPVEVSNRLEELGWTAEELLEVAESMVAARFSCTENDPSSAPGWMSWKDGTRRMREIGSLKGLTKADIDQIPCIIDTKRKLKFSVSNTDDGTAIEGRTPQNHSKKGPGTDRAVTGNQGSLFDPKDAPVVPLSKMKAQPGLLVSWFLLVYVDGDDFRAELSCPVEIEGGFFTDFSERIVLTGPNGSGGVKKRSDEPDDGNPMEFDIPVTRK
jgi:hypothetical protein